MATHYHVPSDKTKPEPGHKVVWQEGEVTLQRMRANWYSVRYGTEVHGSLTYTEACHRLGEALMHQLSCEGKLS